MQRTQLPTLCYWKYGQYSTDRRHAAEPNDQHYTAKKIVTTGNEKSHTTVSLACAGDGSKLRSIVIFKRKIVPKVKNKHKLIRAIQEKGQMDAEGMKSLTCSTWWTGEMKKPAYSCSSKLM